MSAFDYNTTIRTYIYSLNEFSIHYNSTVNLNGNLCRNIKPKETKSEKRRSEETHLNN